MKTFPSYIYFYSLLGLSILGLAVSIQIDINKLNNQFTETTTSTDFDENNLGISTPEVENSFSPEIKHFEISTLDIELESTSNFLFNAKEGKNLAASQKTPGYWKTLHSIESKQGKLLYRPRNKNKNCNNTSSPCGHHQLSVQALKDIKCKTKQCKKDRENFSKSLAMSKKLQNINERRLLKSGYKNLPEYQKYLIHQQGASGLKTILASSKGTKLLSRNLKRNMAGNSPYSYRTLRRMGSKLAAKKFLKHWESKWQSEKKLIIATQPKKQAKSLIDDETTLAIATVDISKEKSKASIDNKKIKKVILVAKNTTTKTTTKKKASKTTKPVIKLAKLNTSKKKSISKKKNITEKRLAKKKINNKAKSNFLEDPSIDIPQFNNYELQLALNIKM